MAKTPSASYVSVLIKELTVNAFAYFQMLHILKDDYALWIHILDVNIICFDFLKDVVCFRFKNLYIFSFNDSYFFH